MGVHHGTQVLDVAHIIFLHGKVVWHHPQKKRLLDFAKGDLPQDPMVYHGIIMVFMNIYVILWYVLINKQTNK